MKASFYSFWDKGMVDVWLLFLFGVYLEFDARN